MLKIQDYNFYAAKLYPNSSTHVAFRPSPKLSCAHEFAIAPSISPAVSIKVVACSVGAIGGER